MCFQLFQVLRVIKACNPSGLLKYSADQSDPKRHTSCGRLVSKSMTSRHLDPSGARPDELGCLDQFSGTSLELGLDPGASFFDDAA
jgi:hypothetical protein